MKAKIILSAIAVLCFGFMASAQEVKIGYTNVEYIMSLMPEMEQIDADISDYGAQLDQQMQAKNVDLQRQFQNYQESATTMTDQARSEREQQLRKLQEDVQKFQQDAQTSYSRKLQELLEPIQTKVYNAINSVAAENNYTHIFSESAGQAGPVLLYTKDDDPFTELVLKKLGITPPANSGN